MDTPRSPSLKRYCVSSAFAHLLLLLFGVAMAPQLRLPMVPEPLSVVMVELPKGPSEDIGLGIPEPPPPPPKTVTPMTEPKPAIAPPVAKTPPKPAPPSEDRKINEALNRINEQLHQRKLPSSSAQSSPGFKYGTSDKPLKEIPPEAELMRYRATVRARILREWIAPAGIRDLPPANRPSVRISVRIGPSGYITSSGFAKRSSNASFDASAMRAVQRANPLPTPPPSVRDMATAQGFTIDFVVR